MSEWGQNRRLRGFHDKSGNPPQARVRLSLARCSPYYRTRKHQPQQAASVLVFAGSRALGPQPEAALGVTVLISFSGALVP